MASARHASKHRQTQITQRAVEHGHYRRLQSAGLSEDRKHSGRLRQRALCCDRRCAKADGGRASSRRAGDRGARQQIAAFENDPRNHRFAAVKHVMASFLQSGMADDLQEAYFLAIQPYQQADAVVIGLAFQIAGKLRPQLDRSAAAQLLIGREPKGFLPPRGRHQMDRDR